MCSPGKQLASLSCLSLAAPCSCQAIQPSASSLKQIVATHGPGKQPANLNFSLFLCLWV